MGTNQIPRLLYQIDKSKKTLENIDMHYNNMKNEIDFSHEEYDQLQITLKYLTNKLFFLLAPQKDVDNLAQQLKESVDIETVETYLRSMGRSL